MNAKHSLPRSALDLADFTPRQGEVLDAALALLVNVGEGLTMSAVAKAASCSKETLYNWFDDREGMLAAIVRWQAAKVEFPYVDFDRLDHEGLTVSIRKFGVSLLRVLSSDISVALNRVAIARTRSSGSNLGAIMLENGRFAMGKQLKPLLEAGADAGLIKFDDSEQAFVTLFGLLIGDIQIRLLLGDKITLKEQQITRMGEGAAHSFMKLYST